MDVSLLRGNRSRPSMVAAVFQTADDAELHLGFSSPA
jgi:hypothetical protein